MYLLAISGGPDSMFLLNNYKDKDIIVAHVNYNKRKDSKTDENIVRDFCNKHNIKCFVLDVKESPKGNFQDWARKIRYNFFKTIYKKHKCTKLLTAHHKDDFIETALMQDKSGRNPKQFGIAKNIKIDGMNIERPLLDLVYKKEILKSLEMNNIEYAVDSTNAQPIFTRNKIRLILDKRTSAQKDNIYDMYVIKNQMLETLNNKICKIYANWKKTNFRLDYFRKIEHYNDEVLFEYIHDNFDNVKVSTGKLKALSEFINGFEGKKGFKLDKYYSLIKDGDFLIK